MKLCKNNVFNDEPIRCYKTVFCIQNEDDIDDMWDFCSNYVRLATLQSNLITSIIHFLYNTEKCQKGKKSKYAMKIYFEFAEKFFYISLKDKCLIEFFKKKSELFSDIKYKILEDTVSLKIQNLSKQEEKEEEKKSKKNLKKNRIEKFIKKTSRVLNDREKDVLKKSRNNIALNAQDYSNDIDEYVMQELQELYDLEIEVETILAEFEDKKNLLLLHEISKNFLKYSTAISLLIEFQDLSFAIKSLGELLLKLENKDIYGNYKKIEMYLANILLDLSNWRKNIFIEQNAKDIHYLDALIFSTILQFELIFNKNEKIEDESDFELF